VKAHDPRRLHFIEVAAHGIPHLLVQLRKVVGLGGGGLAQRLRGESTLRRFGDNEDNLVHKIPRLVPALQAS